MRRNSYDLRCFRVRRMNLIIESVNLKYFYFHKEKSRVLLRISVIETNLYYKSPSGM